MATGRRERRESEACGYYNWEADFVWPIARGSRPDKTHSEFLSRKVEVCNVSDSRGRGLRLASASLEGELLFVEQCVYECEPDAKLANLDMQQWWSGLSHLQRHRVGALAATPSSKPSLGERTLLPNWGENGTVSAVPSRSWLAGVSKLNAMACVELIEKPDGLRSIEATSATNSLLGLFPIGAIMNHSCQPSVTWMPFPGWLAVRTPRPLHADSELTDTYIDVRQPFDSRRQKLQEGWGFHCSCSRCCLEEQVWSDQNHRAKATGLWLGFRAMVESRCCTKPQLANVVSETERLTDQAIEQFLSASTGNQSISSELQPAFNLTKKQRIAARVGRPPEGDQHSSSVQAFQRLRNLLLASYWLSPAIEYAMGLWCTGCVDESLALWHQVVAVVGELCPYSVLHVAYSLQLAACSLEAGQPEDETCALLSQVLLAIRVAYGGGMDTLQILLGQLLQDAKRASVLTRLLERVQKQEALHCVAAPATESKRPSVANGELSRKQPNVSCLKPQGNSAVAEVFKALTVEVGSKCHPVSISVRRSLGSPGWALVAKIEGVEDLSTMQVEASSGGLRIAGSEVALPFRVSVPSATASWSRQRRLVTFTAACNEQPASSTAVCRGEDN